MDSSPEDVKDYKQMWSEAIKEYSKAAGYRHEHDLYKEIEENFKTKKDASPQKTSAKVANAFWGAAPDAVNFAGQVAALSFPPAAIIATVANFFVSAGKRYHELFSGMDSVRTQIQFYFEQMKLREEHELNFQAFEPHLKQYDFLRLCSYLKICGFIKRYSKQADQHEEGTKAAPKSKSEVKQPSEDTRRKKRDIVKGIFKSDKPEHVEERIEAPRTRDKAKLFYNLLTGSDEINDELKIIDDLTKKYNEARSNDDHMRGMRIEDDVKERSIADSLKKSLKIIKSNLHIHDERIAGQEVHSKLEDRAIGGMGEWILHQDLFATWNDIDTPTQEPILKLEGPEKHGKTFLCHRIISHLQANNRKSHHETLTNGSSHGSNNPPNGSLTTTSIAYYYFGKDGSDKKDETTLQDAIAVIIWQLVQNDYVYRQFVAEACDPTGSPLQKQSLWELLKPRASSRFFIVLDGIDHSTEKTARGLLDYLSTLQPETDASRQTRVLLSGTGQSLDCARNFGKTIDLKFAKETKHDLELFAKHFLYDQNQALQDGSQPTDQVLNILLSMQTNVKTFDAIQDSDISTGIRNYDFIEFLLGKINDNLWSAEKVRELAEKLSTGGKFALVQYQLEHASQVLGKEEVKDFNEILPWLTLPCNSWPELQMIEDILTISRGGSRPAISTRTYISGKFNDLMKLEGEVQVSVTSGHLAGYFTEKFQMTAEQTVTEETGYSRRDGQPNNELHPSEIAMVKNLLKSVCGDDLYKKFGFVQFFNEKEEPLRQGIYFHPIQGHIQIITTCLKAICHTETDDYQSLFQYTALRLPWHLSQIDPEMLSDGQIAAVANIMPLLCRFFDDDEVIERWFKVDWLNSLRDSWFSAANDENFISKWFNDPIIARYRDPEVESFRKTVSNIWNNASFLKKPTATAAWYWAQADGPKWNSFQISYRWIKNVVDRERSSEDAETVEEAEGSVLSIQQAECWTWNNLEFPPGTWRNALWQSRIAEAFKFYGHHDEATDRYESVFLDVVDLEFAKNHMRSYANAVRKRDGDYERALQVLEPLIEQFKSLGPFQDEELEKWLEIIHNMCIIYNDAGRAYEAMSIGQYGLELSPRNLRIIATMVDWAFVRDQFDAIINALNQLTPEELTTLLDKYGTLKSIQRIAVAASRVDSSSFIETCERALPNPGELRSKDASLCLCYSLVLTWDSRLGDNREKAMKLWQELLRLQYRDDEHWKVRGHVGALLACAYLQLAVERDQKQISKQDQETFFFYRHRGLDPPTLMDEEESFYMARFHHLRQRDDLAKALLETKISFAAQLLRDDVVENDFIGYWVLAIMLLCLSRDDDAAAAYAMSFRALANQKHLADLGDTQDCSGWCGTEFGVNLDADRYLCKDCARTFDEQCFKKVKEGSLGLKLCSKDHKFTRIPKWDEAAEERHQNGRVLVGDQERDREEWTDETVQWILEGLG